MHCRFLFIFTLTLWSAGGLLLPKTASAEVPFTSAIVQDLRNQVRLLLKNQAPRPAQRSDKMTPGDALATARAALAEMRFNDGSITRVGEQTLFRFQPNTRSFRLDNGTLLLVIPPGQGETRVRTPNAAAGIRGSALFVRYNPDTDTTLVGALTNSQIEVSNQDKSQRQVLKAGQMAVITQNRIERVYDFDLNTFYETSELAKGLDLPRRNATANPDPAIAAVQIETAEAIRAQAPLVGQGIVDNPAFVRLANGVANLNIPALGRDSDRTVFTGISAFTGVASDLRRLGSGKQIPSETGTQVVVSAPPSLTSSPNVSITSSTLVVAPIVGSPAPLPGNPNPPEVPVVPTSGLPTAPIAGSPAPLPGTPTPPSGGTTAISTPPVSTPAPANPTPAPAPLPPATTVVVQPPTTTVVQPPTTVIQPPTSAPAPLPPATTVVVQPPTTTVVQPPTTVIVQPPTTTVIQPPALAPAPLPPATTVVVQPPTTVVQPPAPAPVVVQPPTITVVQPPAPAPLPPAAAVVVQPPAAAVVASPSTPIDVTPAQARTTPTAAPSLTPTGSAAVVTATPPVNSVSVTSPSTDRPPITPTANPAVQSAPVLSTTPAVVQPAAASSIVAPSSIK